MPRGHNTLPPQDVTAPFPLPTLSVLLVTGEHHVASFVFYINVAGVAEMMSVCVCVASFAQCPTAETGHVAACGSRPFRLIAV